MNSDDITLNSYLNELYRLTGGDTERQVSMYDVGASIGLDKAEAGSLAEHLMVQGLADLKTLAGGIGITAEGMASLGFSAAPAADEGNTLHLGTERVANDSDRQVIQLLTEEIKGAILGQQIDYVALEEIIIDLKTIEVQLLSPQPKNRVLAELFRSLQTLLESAGMEKLATKLAAAVNNHA